MIHYVKTKIRVKAKRNGVVKHYDNVSKGWLVVEHDTNVSKCWLGI